MKSHITLDPQLDMSAEQFAAAWNHSPYASQYGPAHLQTPTAETFSTELAVALITIAVSIPVTILTDFTVELLKAKYLPPDKPASPPPHTIIINQITINHNEPLFIISPEEKTE
jgi:hypothetical protein